MIMKLQLLVFKNTMFNKNWTVFVNEKKNKHRNSTYYVIRSNIESYTYTHSFIKRHKRYSSIPNNKTKL